ncbi:MAG TPA: hypothetical protein VHY22_16100, partial [Chthoniobacteraceae bacterium]|nr:hypothetical protein [Chthoniobacteraceae bacterium]
MRRFVVWAVLLTGCVAPAWGRDRDAVSRLPPLLPEPTELQAEVPRGGPVWITLSAYSLTSPIIRFRIKEKPQGTVGAPELLPDGRARVRYEPPSGNGPGTDSFTYEVQSEAGVSSDAEVHIKLTDVDPQLTAPTELDFGEVLPGQVARRTLDVQNIGGGVAEGGIRVPEGWSVEGDPAYSIPRGGKQTFTILFQPTEQ